MLPCTATLEGEEEEAARSDACPEVSAQLGPHQHGLVSQTAFSHSLLAGAGSGLSLQTRMVRQVAMPSQPRWGSSSSAASLLMRSQAQAVPTARQSKHRMSIRAWGRERAVSLLLPPARLCHAQSLLKKPLAAPSPPGMLSACSGCGCHRDLSLAPNP